MESASVTSEHSLILLVFSGAHFLFFHLIKAFVPYIASDRKRLSWVLTVKACLVLSLTGSYLAYDTIQTIFSSPTPFGSDCGVSQSWPAEVVSRDNMSVRGQYRSHVVAMGPVMSDQSSNYQGPALLALDASVYHPHYAMDPGFAGPGSTNKGDIIARLRVQRQIEELHSTHRTLAHSARGWVTDGKATEAAQSRWFFDLRSTPADSWAGQMLTVYFVSYLLMDLVCGWLYYREKVNLLTGWFHHTLYLGLCYKALHLRYAHLLACHMVMEWLGQIYKPFRSDLLFAVTFFLSRILMDCLLSHEVIANRPDVPLSLKSFIVFKSALHIKFLVDLVRQQIRLWSKRTQQSRAPTANSVHMDAFVKAETEFDKGAPVEGICCL
ncbi:hypothetical protein BGZ70_007108 [Mortierella alpina]|uniref:TLC domain-containing protein n=1 Tax=Mortierella alpina TaxID=64518 RepID=A0A9P6M373_MORAP|nr:hypothetical protein BGZ70_007108 [Mortierella alpina]